MVKKSNRVVVEIKGPDKMRKFWSTSPIRLKFGGSTPKMILTLVVYSEKVVPKRVYLFVDKSETLILVNVVGHIF